MYLNAEAYDLSQIAKLAERLAKILRDHFQIDGGPPPPSGGATPNEVLDVITTIFHLQNALRVRGGDSFAIDPDWEVPGALERISIAILEIRAAFGEERDGAAITEPSLIPSKLVAALEYGAKKLIERQQVDLLVSREDVAALSGTSVGTIENKISGEHPKPGCHPTEPDVPLDVAARAAVAAAAVEPTKPAKAASSKDWIHHPGDTRPPQFKDGPVSGTREALGYALRPPGKRNVTPRALLDHFEKRAGRVGSDIYVVAENSRLVTVWFTSPKAALDAENAVSEYDKKNESTSAEQKRAEANGSEAK